MKLLKRLTDVLLYISLTACIIGTMLFVLPNFIGYEIYAQTERSFDGRIEKGSLVYFERCDPAGISIGDVAIFEGKDAKAVDAITYIDYETNRIDTVSVTECQPQSFKFTALKGRRTLSIRGLGYVYSFIFGNDGRAVVMFVLLFILIMSIGADTLYAFLGYRKKRLRTNE